jgi:AP-1 complex subunit sigma 1/2
VVRAPGAGRLQVNLATKGVRPTPPQVLDRYFGNVCELDLIFNFHKAYHILDELLICGELQEPSKKAILRVTAAQDALMEGSGDSKVSDSKYEI